MAEERNKRKAQTKAIRHNRTGKRRLTKKGKRKLLLRRLILGTFALVVIAIVTFVISQGFAVYGKCTMEAGTEAAVEDFCRFHYKNAKFAKGSEDYDPTVPGEYKLKIKDGLFTHTCKLTIKDTIAPKLTMQDMKVGTGMTIEPMAFVADADDVTEVVAEFVDEPDWLLINETQDVTIRVTDAGGNATEGTAKLVVLPIIYEITIEAGDDAPTVESFLPEGYEDADAKIMTDLDDLTLSVAGDYPVEIEFEGVDYDAMIHVVDTTAPVFTVANDFSVTLGESISYKSHVTVKDNSGDYTLDVDSSKVNPAELGTYEVTYTATDASGNSTVATVQMTIEEQKSTTTELNERVDAILANIITADMSQRDKAWAIFTYIRSHVGYVSSSEKGDYEKAALQALKQGQGDCYVYFSIAKVMLTRAGITNMDIERIPEGNHMHYWNLVDIGDGHGWYHYDTTPRVGHPVQFLWDDATVTEYSNTHENCYNYDRSKYPDIP